MYKKKMKIFEFKNMLIITYNNEYSRFRKK